MKTHFVDSFFNKYVLKWSFWWALSTCGFIQAQNYMQPLWSVIRKEEGGSDEDDETLWNGLVEAILTIIGFLGALLAGFLKVNWKTKGELVLSVCSILEGFALLYASYTEQVFICYVSYVIFGAIYHFMITIASSEIAKQIKDDTFGLVFGINTFVALGFQSLLTAIVVTKGVGFALPPRTQFFIYGVFHISIAVIFIVIGLSNWVTSKRGRDYV